MYLFCRSLDFLVTVLDKWGLIKKIPFFEVYMFAPAISFLIYAHFYENSCFPKGIDKAFLAVTKPTVQELTIFSEVYGKAGQIMFPPYKGNKLRI